MRYKENKIALLILLVCCCQAIVAQNISVSSFKLLENDLTANTTGTIERDQNGEVAALIKVITTEQGFVFDGGMVGVVKTQQRVGEVWVYVPHGIKRIKIQHQQLGTLSEYYFPVPIDMAKTYELVLTTGKVETVVTHAINKQFVIFNVKPVNAIVELDDEVLTVDDEGYAEKGLPFGTYNYRVSCTNYHTEAGQVVVNANGKAEVDVALRPNFGWIKFDGTSEYHGAHIYIDNERVGQLPFTSKEIKSGTHQVRVVKSMYKTYEQQVVVSDNETTSLNVTMNPNFANITLITDAESEIWVDGKLKGKGEWTGPMEIGEYNVEVKKESHRTQSKIIHIAALSERSIQLPSPTPIYGGLEITSTPSRATVYIDDVEVGETPLILSNVLVGRRNIELKKDGYVDSKSRSEVIEKNSVSINLLLQEAPKDVNVGITCNPIRATVTIDGKYIGVSPVNTKLSVGEHEFTIAKGGYKSITEYRTVSAVEKDNFFHYELKYLAKKKLELKRQDRRNKMFMRPVYNESFTMGNFYLEGNVEMSSKGVLGYGGTFGAYLFGWNYDFSYQPIASELLVVRTGWGFNCGKRLLFTPQIGWGCFLNVSCSRHSWGHVIDVLPISCRAQYCLTKVIAFNLTAEYLIHMESECDFYYLNNTVNNFYLRAGIVLNMDLTQF